MSSGANGQVPIAQREPLPDTPAVQQLIQESDLLRSQLTASEMEIQELHTRIEELQNRDYAMRQELVSKMEENLGPANAVEDQVFIGYTIPSPGRPRAPYYIPFDTLKKSVTLLGKQGSGKSNLGFATARQLLNQGVDVLTFDVSGEWVPFYDGREVLMPDEFEFNPFDNLGIWNDMHMHEFIQRTFFSFLNVAGKRSAVNLGSISLMLKEYFQYYPPEERSLLSFVNFVHDHQDMLGIAKGTMNSILGYLREFIHNPRLNKIFCVKKTHPKIKAAIMQQTSLCVVMKGVGDEIRSILSFCMIQMIWDKMKEDFFNKRSTDARALTYVIILEETANIIKGEQEQKVMQNILKDSRKYGLSSLTFPRSESALKEMGVKNILEEVGVIATFAINEYPTLKNTQFMELVKQYGPRLQPGEAIFLVDGRVDRVQCVRHYEISDHVGL